MMVEIPVILTLGHRNFHGHFTIELKTTFQEVFLPSNRLIAIPIMTRDLHYVFGDTKLARLEALVRGYEEGGMRREVCEER